MNKRTILKWCLIALASLLSTFVIFVCFILWLLTDTGENGNQSNGGDYTENLRRSNLAISLKIDAEDYYKQHKQYPQITELYSFPDVHLIDYLRSGVISYDAGNDNFCVRYIKSDKNFQRPDQKYSKGWNGKQYCSKKEHLRGVSEDWQPDSNGFYIYDLH